MEFKRHLVVEHCLKDEACSGGIHAHSPFSMLRPEKNTLGFHKHAKTTINNV